ncbi:hypothetical protein [Streptomyces graminofaciens]|nr:hypothetical protein [Streptomyces graminofaciens]
MADYRVALCEQNSNRFLVYGRTETAWNNTTADWVFDPGNSRTPWNNPFEIRFRKVGSATYAFMTAGQPGNGRAGAVKVMGNGSRLGYRHLCWQASIPTYPHSIEHIPGRNVVVVACSHGRGQKVGEIRVYGPSGSGWGATPVQIINGAALGKLVEPHGVLWDDQANVLRVIGGPVLRTYEVRGRGRAARLRKVGADIDLRRDDDGAVRAGKHYGHDVQPDYSDAGRLVITDSNGVYAVDRRTRRKTDLRVGGEFALVKSFVIHPSGQWMWTRDVTASDSVYGGEVVRFSTGGDRRKSLAQIYKARIVTTRFH